jgi:fucose 4-O-acetylase-like acetyltransferase
VTGVIPMSTPLVRDAGVLAALPDIIEAYIRPLPGMTTFALFPWAAFLLGGTIAGEVIYAAKTARAERRVQLGLLAAGAIGFVSAYWLSFQPSIYANANFWTSSPTFFFIRLGVNTMLLPIAWSIERYASVIITTLGRSSLFVYWVHVEMVYGVSGRPLRRLLPIELSLLATVSLCGLLYLLVLWKDRKMREIKLTGPFRILSPVLK